MRNGFELLFTGRKKKIFRNVNTQVVSLYSEIYPTIEEQNSPRDQWNTPDISVTPVNHLLILNTEEKNLSLKEINIQILLHLKKALFTVPGMWWAHNTCVLIFVTHQKSLSQCQTW